MEKLTYKCSECGWEKAIPAQWADVSPRYCGNKKCKYSGRIKRERTSFLKEPKALLIIKQEKPEPPKHEPVSKKKEKVKSEIKETQKKTRGRRKSRRGQ